MKPYSIFFFYSEMVLTFWISLVHKNFIPYSIPSQSFWPTLDPWNVYIYIYIYMWTLKFTWTCYMYTHTHTHTHTHITYATKRITHFLIFIYSKAHKLICKTRKHTTCLSAWRLQHEQALQTIAWELWTI